MNPPDDTHPQTYYPYSQPQNQALLPPSHPSHPSNQYDNQPISSQHPQYSQQQSTYPQQQYFEQNFLMPSYGYLPPNQYNANAANTESQYSAHSRPLVMAEIKDIEHRLDHGWYQCYKIYLCFWVFLASCDLIQTFVYSFFFGEIGGYIASIVCSVWIIYQSVLEISAMRKRDFVKGNRALVAMIIFAVLDVAAVIALTLLYTEMTGHLKGHPMQREYTFSLLMFYSSNFLVHLFLTVFGAMKVRALLKKRQGLFESMTMTMNV